MIKSKVYFSKSGSGSVSARITVPKEYINLMKINELEKEISIDVIDGKLIIEKINTNKIENVSYDEMVKFILNNVEYTYNVAKYLNDFINNMGECGIEEDIFYMTDDQEHFNIRTHYEILNQDTDDEEIIFTYDVEKL